MKNVSSGIAVTLIIIILFSLLIMVYGYNFFRPKYRLLGALDSEGSLIPLTQYNESCYSEADIRRIGMTIRRKLSIEDCE